jgi:hypothetical protein
LGITLSSLSISSLPFNSLDQISFSSLTQIYEKRWDQISHILQAPFIKGLYESYLALPPFAQQARAISVPTHVYVGLKDSQIAPEWALEDSNFFRKLVSISIFKNYGHCFSPLEGSIGQIKTSGPLSTDVIGKILEDITLLISNKSASPF